MKRSDLTFLLLSLLISSIGILALLRPGFFLTDDGNSMVIRFSAFYEALRSGQFPVRFLSRLNFGYGYPVADFLYPLFMYIGVPIKALGFSFVDTVKIIFGLSFISGTVFSFLWLRKLFDDKSALIGSIIYSLFPYHLYDIYVRGSVGEVLSLGVLPFILWQIERRNLVWGSIGIFLLILSHNTLGVLFLIFILFYGLLDIYAIRSKKELFSYYAKTILIGLGLSSFFSIPAISDLQYTVFSKTSVSDWSKYFVGFNLIGFSTVVVFLTIFTFILIKKIELKKHRLTLLMIGVGLVSIFLASSLSSPLWGLLPVSFIQFPFRFLSLTIVTTAFLAASVVSVLKGKNRLALIISLLILTFLSSKNFLTPSVFQNYPDSFYSTNQDSTTVRNEYMPKWIKEPIREMAPSKVENLSGREKINIRKITASKINFDTLLSEDRTIRVNIVYFPGWNAYVNGNKSNIIHDDGFINLHLNKGENKVLVKFEETSIRLMADLISILSLFILIGLSLKKNLKFL